MSQRITRITRMGCVALSVCLVVGTSPAQTSEVELRTILQTAVELQQAGDYAGAIREYERFLSSGPEDAGVLSNLGAAYSAGGKRSNATSGLCGWTTAIRSSA